MWHSILSNSLIGGGQKASKPCMSERAFLERQRNQQKDQKINGFLKDKVAPKLCF